MTRPTAVFVEVSSPGWAFWRAALDTCVGLSVGTLYTFLGIVVVGIVGEEALSSLYWQIDLDPLFRASMGVILLIAAVLAIVVPFVLVAERFAALRAVEASARENPDAVPQRSLRTELAKAPAAYLQTTGTVLFWCLVGLGALFALAVVFTEDLREDGVVWAVLLVFAVLALAAAMLRRLGRRLVERDDARMRDHWSRWKQLVPRAEACDSDRREAAIRAVAPQWLSTPSRRTLGRVARVLLTATLISLGAFMISVFMRQQCRNCDPVYWNEPIENGIDVLSLSSGAALAVCAALGILAWVGGVVLQFARERALASWVSDGASRSVDVSLVEPLLSGTRSMVRLQLGLTAVGAGAVVVGMGALWAEWAAMDTRAVLLTAVVLIALGLAVGWADARRSRRERQLARDALFPGDVGRVDEDKPAAITRERRRRR
ncbi:MULTISPECIES: hypothetical protein [Microbacterium]|uniref:hypothetical protein n=1 Tax=Microbacterium TaxID=33882 RepID=UPI0005AC6C26|nr:MULTISPECIES: hypothetical protein [Microbacterium]AQY00801.1 hypothetical protein B2G67_04445 [Microbacterium foliorum]KIP92695.1 hypothetical protein RU09_07615 [Microbacterium sp. MEJ108Y]